MAARSKQSKQDRRKDQASAQETAQPVIYRQEDSREPEPRGHEADAYAKTAYSQRQPNEQRGGMVRKSTLYLTSVLCLLLGTYLGTLLPALRGARDIASPSVQPAQSQQASSTAVGTGGHSDDRFKELEEAVKKNPQDMRSWIQLGNQYFDNNHPREAIRAYERALSIKGDNPDVLTDMGIMHRQIDEFERAIEKFTQASKINPLHEQSRFNLGVVLFYDLNRKDEARKVWRALIGINPQTKTPDGELLSKMLDRLK